MQLCLSPKTKGVRTFSSNELVEAVEVTDRDKAMIQELTSFSGMGVTATFATDGSLRSVTLKNSKDTLVALTGQFIYKNSSGVIGVCNLDHLAEKYEEVTESNTTQ